MKIHRSYKVEIKPNNKQKTFLEKSFGISRLAYNWGLDLSIKQYEQGEKYLGAFGLHKELVKLKKDRFNFMYEVSKMTPQNAIRDLDIAFKNFFKSCKSGKKVGFPKFKSRHDSKQSFRIDGLGIKVFESHIKLPKLSKIKLKESNHIPLKDVKYLNATISRCAGKYYIAVAVESEWNQCKKIEERIGIDLGIKELATLSNGEVFHNPKYTTKYTKKLKQEQRKLSRKVKGSKNRLKQKLKVQKVHNKIRNSRIDYLHKMTSSITKNKCRQIMLEDLSVSGMLKNRKLSKAISDSSFYEIKRQLQYKVDWYGGKLCLINKWFPSSKLCSKCGAIKEDLKLSDRKYVCKCGLNIDRDLNASINIQNFKFNKDTVGSTEIDAFGENVSLGSDLLDLSSFVELGIQHENLNFQ